MKVGLGFDVHRYAEETGAGQVKVGGVAIPHSHAVVAHSDGDVLIHALCDALLGAAGLGDIGRHFPDSDPQYRGIDSRVLLRAVAGMVTAQGLKVCNVDSVLMAQAPRFAPHIEAMQRNLAADLGIPTGAVNVKATTTERLGFVGREEGLAAQAIVLLE